MPLLDSRLGRWLWRFYNLFVVALAFFWRRLLRKTTLIAITGSVGKTTAKECLSAILATRFPMTSTIGNSAARRGLPRTLLRTRWRHRFVVAEVAIHMPGVMWRPAWLLRPDIVLITSVRWQHSVNFRSLELIAKEKAKLLSAMRRGGLAVLNGDDPLVAAMANPARFRTTSFGTSPGFEVWATDVSAAWPRRLTFQVHSPEGSRKVETRLVGAHWVPSVLDAIAVARACGVSLEDSVEALRQAEPFPARLQPVTLPSGAILLRDEYNGAMDTLLRALLVLEESAAARKVVVMGNISDARETPAQLPVRLGRQVARIAQTVVFIGGWAGDNAAAAVAAGMDQDQVHAFPHPEQAALFLKQELRAGDLILLKGMFSDHLPRVYFAQIGTVHCWKKTCAKTGLCDNCRELGFRPRRPSTDRDHGV